MQDNRDTLKIIQQNVLKWTFTRKNELSNYYIKEDPDIILLNSTGISDDIKIKIFNYNVHQKNTYGEDHAGVAIAIRRNIKYQLIDGYDSDILAIKVNTTLGDAIIATSYIPPRRQYFPLAELRTLLQKRIPVYLIGDFNATHQHWGYTYSNNRGREIVDLIRRNICTFQGPDFNTIINATGAGKPDLVLSNRNAFLHNHITEGHLTTSDHLPMVITISTKPIMVPTTMKLNLKKTNWENFKEKVEERMTIESDRTAQEININKNKIEEGFERWLDIVKTELEAATPIKQYKTIKNFQDSDFLKLLKERYKDLRNNNAQWDRNSIQETRNIQEAIKEESLRLTNENWDSLIANLDSNYKDPTKFWKDVKKLKGNNTEIITYIIDENNNNNKVHQPEEQIKLFQKYWSNIFQISHAENRRYDIRHERQVIREIRNQPEKYKSYEIADLQRLNNDNPLTLKVTKQTIKNIIKNFKNKAPGKSGITKQVLTNLPDVALEQYANLVNFTISMGYFPVIFKEGIIILILKPGKNPRLLTSYRPITLLEVPGKILERILNDRLTLYMEQENKFHKEQYGFRKNKGTDMALTKLYETIAINQQERGQCNIIQRDIEKAFDKVWHEGLRFKIGKLGLPEILEKSLISFTKDRRARIRYRGQISELINLRSGVPQGSILSPTLFILYTADTPQAGPGATDVMFADDVSQIVEYPHGSKRMLAIRTEREIKRINDFENKWKIKTSENKFKVLSISAKKPHDIRINNRVIPFANKITVLGLQISPTGINPHVTERIRKASNELKRLKRFKNLSPKTKIHLFKACIRSIVEYPITPICGLSKSNKIKLQRLQNQALKFIMSNDEENMTLQQAHEKYNIDPVNVRLHKRGLKTWTKFVRNEQELAEKSIQLNEDNTTRDHYWWGRIGRIQDQDEPDGIYT